MPASPAHAVFIGNAQGGTDFPEGAASFADQLVDYAPVVKNGEPSPANSDATNASGLPDYVSGGGCTDPATCTFVSLGDGGKITLRFTDNVLTGSDSDALDLWIFEVGPDIEDTFVEISGDGATWSPVGKVFGSTAGIDIDAFGFGATSSLPTCGLPTTAQRAISRASRSARTSTRSVRSRRASCPSRAASRSSPPG
ncbi:MAG: hypothetical protein MZV65_35700 [Chromatiales bacterium]|nr:hypothetical protein [Chromatiales bacterium]